METKGISLSVSLFSSPSYLIFAKTMSHLAPGNLKERALFCPWIDTKETANKFNKIFYLLQVFPKLVGNARPQRSGEERTASGKETGKNHGL